MNTTTQYAILFINDIICARVIELYAIVKSKSYFKHEVKSRANELKKRRKQYETAANFSQRKQEERFADANDMIDGLVSSDIERLRLRMLSHDDSELKEELTLMRVIDVLGFISNYIYRLYARRYEDRYLDISNLIKANCGLYGILTSEKKDIDITEFAMPIITKIYNVENVKKAING